MMKNSSALFQIKKSLSSRLVDVLARLLDTYEWLMEGALAKKLSGYSTPSRATVWLEVDHQLKVCLDDIGEEEGNASSDETLVSLIWAYGWLYRTGLLEQLTALTGTVLSCLHLDEYDQEVIEGAMAGEEPEARFALIQSLYLAHAKRRLQKGE